MTEPTTLTSAAVSGTLILFGVATGLPADLIFPAFIGALWALAGMPQSSLVKRTGQVLVGTLFAAWVTPPALVMAAEIVPQVDKIPHEILRYPVALILGWCGLSVLLDRIARRMSGS